MYRADYRARCGWGSINEFGKKVKTEYSIEDRDKAST